MRLDLDPLVLFLQHLHDLLDDLICQEVNVRATLDGADGIHETHLLELPVTQRADDLPAVATRSPLDNLRELSIILSLEVEVRIGHKVLDVDSLVIEFDFD